MELFALGVVIGGLVTLGICVFELWKSRKSAFKDDSYERTLKELEVGFKQLDQKYLDLYVEVEQMRTILKNNGFEKDVDIPSTLRTLNEKVETIRLNYEFDKKSNNETISGLVQDVIMVKKYVTRIAAGNEY
jgi:hypothetical protein